MPPSSTSTTTPLLSSFHASIHSTTLLSHVPTALPRPPWAFRLRLQYHLQLGLSSLALALAVLMILKSDGSSSNHNESWCEASSLTLAGIGLALDLGVLLVLAQYGKHQASAGEGRETRVGKRKNLFPLTVQLLFNASILGPYVILSVVLGLTTISATAATATTGVKIEEAGLAALVATVAFSQLFSSIYFFRLVRISQAFNDTILEQQEQQEQQQQQQQRHHRHHHQQQKQLLSRRYLKDLFRVLGLKPSPSELAELAAIVEAEEEEMEAKLIAAAVPSSSNSTSRSSSGRGHDKGWTFEDVCRILAHYTEIHASRKRHQHRRRRALEEAAAGGEEGRGTILPPPTAAAAALPPPQPSPESNLF